MTGVQTCALPIWGTAKSTIENVRIRNSQFSGVEGADRLANSGSVTYENVTIQAAPRPRATAAPATAPKE